MLIGRLAAEHSPPTRRRRISKRVVRTWAYVGGALSFVVPWAILNQAPRPAAANASTNGQAPTIEVHKIVRRIIVDAPNAPVPSGGAPQIRYVYIGVGGGGGSAPTSTHCSTCP